MKLIFFIIISLAAFTATACDANWLMGHSRVSFLIKVHGREKARMILLWVFAAMSVAGFLWLYLSV